MTPAEPAGARNSCVGTAPGVWRVWTNRGRVSTVDGSTPERQAGRMGDWSDVSLVPGVREGSVVATSRDTGA